MQHGSPNYSSGLSRDGGTKPPSAPVTRATCPQASHKTESVYVPRHTEHVVRRHDDALEDMAQDVALAETVQPVLGERRVGRAGLLVRVGSMPFAQMHYRFENKERFDQNFPGDFIVEYVAQRAAGSTQ